MPTFRYTAMDARGAEVEASIAAADQTDAIAKIRQRGFFPTKVTQVAARNRTVRIKRHRSAPEPAAPNLTKRERSIRRWACTFLYGEKAALEKYGPPEDTMDGLRQRIVDMEELLARRDERISELTLELERNAAQIRRNDAEIKRCTAWLKAHGVVADMGADCG